MHRIQKICLKLILTASCLATSFVTAACPSAPIDISTTIPLPQTATASQIGSDANGNAVAVWREYDGTDTFIKSASYILGGWQAPLTVSTTLGTNDTNQNPQISVNPISGNAYVIWLENGNTVKTSRLPFNGVWTAPDTLSSSAANFVGAPKIANFKVVDQAVAVWVQNTGSNNFLQSAFFDGSSWGSPIDIVPLTAQSLSFPQIGYAPGTATAYALWENLSTNQMQSASSTGGAWTSLLNVGGSSAPFIPSSLGVGDNGELTAAWSYDSGANLVVRYSQFSGVWSAPITLSPTTGSQQALATHSNGDTMIVWQENVAPSIFAIRSAYISPFGAPAVITNITSLAPTSVLADVAMDLAGNAYAVWRRGTIGNFHIQFATFPFGGSGWSSPCDISSLAEDSSVPHISSTLPGFAIMDWPNNTNIVIQAAAFPAPPTVISITPTSGSTSGGNTVLITGTDLSNVTSVEFGAGNFASFTIISDTQIIAVAPPSVPVNSPGTVSVILTNLAGIGSLPYTYELPICWQR